MDPPRDTRDPAGTALRAYVREVDRIPRLTAERERSLARRAAKGDAAAADALACAHLHLVASLARPFAGRGLPLEDLIQEGSLGLVRAARHFDWRRGVRFRGYAVPWIRGGICDAVEANAATTVASDDVGELADVIADESALAPYRVAAAHELIDEIERALRERLTARERVVIRCRFGFSGDVETLDQVGVRVGLKKERVRRIEMTALGKLRPAAQRTALGPSDGPARGPDQERQERGHHHPPHRALDYAAHRRIDAA